jgi:exopolysaccharide/PEP-CTERM locus tyrosine autokinase
MSRIEKSLEKATQLRQEAATQMFKHVASAGGEIVPLPNVSPYLVTITEPESGIAEEYRKLKSMIVRLTHQKGLLNTLLVTSATMGEGKTLTALNLAVTLAQQYDHTVLLVDADFRGPSIHRYLGIEPSAGLADCLTDGRGIEEMLIRVHNDKLTFLPAGRSVKNPLELLSSRRMKDIMREMKERYGDRYVIVDSPPVLSFADAQTLSTLVHGVIFVVKEGSVSIDKVTDAMTLMRDGSMLGVVFNNSTTETPGSRYYYEKYSGGEGEGRK